MHLAGNATERNGSFQMTERKASETKLLCGMRSHTCQPARSPSVGTVRVLAAGPNEGQGQEVVQGCLWVICRLNLPPYHLSLWNVFLFLRMGFLHIWTPTLLLALPAGRSHGFCPRLPSSQPSGLVCHWDRQNLSWQISWHTFLTPLPGAQKPQAWILASPESLGELPDFTGSRSLHLQTGLTPQVCGVLTWVWSSVRAQ